MANYTEEQLESKTNRELKEICKKLGIPGMSKKRKDDLIDSIVEKQGEPAGNSATISKSEEPEGELTAVQGIVTVQKDGSNPATISCGASSGKFSVVGRQVNEVSELLKEVLNIERNAKCIVNGVQVEDDYVLKEGDNLIEYLKPAGKKGC